MRYFTMLFSIILSLNVTSAGANTPLRIDPLKLYGPEIGYDIVRNGVVIGRHNMRFQDNQGRLQVSAQTEIDMSILFIPVYRFRYQATEIWEQGKLASLSVAVDDDGQKSQITTANSDRPTLLTIQTMRPDQQSEIAISPEILTTNHWNPAVIKQNKVLNTLTGRLNQVQIIDHGTDRLADLSMDAHKYEYTGQLKDVFVWYTSSGQWVKLSFKAKDGSQIEYICRKCQG